jgi:hypothetical protein
MRLFTIAVIAALLLDASVVRASDDASSTVPPQLLVAHRIIPAGHIATLVDSPQAVGFGHPTVRSQIIFLVVLAVATVVILKLAIPSK